MWGTSVVKVPWREILNMTSSKDYLISRIMINKLRVMNHYSMINKTIRSWILGENQTNREQWLNGRERESTRCFFLAVCTSYFLLVDVINGWPWARERERESNDNSLLSSLLFSIVFLRLSVQFEVSPLIMITLFYSRKDHITLFYSLPL